VALRESCCEDDGIGVELSTMGLDIDGVQRLHSTQRRWKRVDDTQELLSDCARRASRMSSVSGKRQKYELAWIVVGETCGCNLLGLRVDIHPWGRCPGTVKTVF